MSREKRKRHVIMAGTSDIDVLSVAEDTIACQHVTRMMWTAVD